MPTLSSPLLSKVRQTGGRLACVRGTGIVLALLARALTLFLLFGAFLLCFRFQATYISAILSLSFYATTLYFWHAYIRRHKVTGHTTWIVAAAREIERSFSQLGDRLGNAVELLVEPRPAGESVALLKASVAQVEREALPLNFDTAINYSPLWKNGLAVLLIATAIAGAAVLQPTTVAVATGKLLLPGWSQSWPEKTSKLLTPNDEKVSSVKLSAFQAEVTLPNYLASKKAPQAYELLSQKKLRVVAGSTLKLTPKFARRVQSITVHARDKTLPVKEGYAELVVGKKPASFPWQLTWRDLNGLRGQSQRFLVEVVADATPQVTLTHPAEDLLVLPGITLNVQASAEDDWGLKSVTLLLDGEEKNAEQLNGNRNPELELPLTVPTFPAAKLPHSSEYALLVEDLAGQKTVSTQRRLIVATEHQIEQHLAQSLSQVRELLVAAQTKLRSSRSHRERLNEAEANLFREAGQRNVQSHLEKMTMLLNVNKLDQISLQQLLTDFTNRLSLLARDAFPAAHLATTPEKMEHQVASIERELATMLGILANWSDFATLQRQLKQLRGEQRLLLDDATLLLPQVLGKRPEQLTADARLQLRNLLVRSQRQRNTAQHWLVAVPNVAERIKESDPVATTVLQATRKLLRENQMPHHLAESLNALEQGHLAQAISQQRSVLTALTLADERMTGRLLDDLIAQVQKLKELRGQINLVVVETATRLNELETMKQEEVTEEQLRWVAGRMQRLNDDLKKLQPELRAAGCVVILRHANFALKNFVQTSQWLKKEQIAKAQQQLTAAGGELRELQRALSEHLLQARNALNTEQYFLAKKVLEKTLEKITLQTKQTEQDQYDANELAKEARLLANELRMLAGRLHEMVVLTDTLTAIAVDLEAVELTLLYGEPQEKRVEAYAKVLARVELVLAALQAKPSVENGGDTETTQEAPTPQQLTAAIEVVLLLDRQKKLQEKTEVFLTQKPTREQQAALTSDQIRLSLATLDLLKTGEDPTSKMVRQMLENSLSDEEKEETGAAQHLLPLSTDEGGLPPIGAPIETSSEQPEAPTGATEQQEQPQLDPLASELNTAAVNEDESPLLAAADQMRLAAGTIRASEWKRAIYCQKEAVRILERMLENLGQAKAKTGNITNPNSGNNNSTSTQSDGADGSAGGGGTGSDEVPPLTQGETERLSKLLTRVWGELPPREREKILQTQIQKLPPQYRRFLEQYYRKLAE